MRLIHADMIIKMAGKNVYKTENSTLYPLETAKLIIKNLIS